MIPTSREAGPLLQSKSPTQPALRHIAPRLHPTHEYFTLKLSMAKRTVKPHKFPEIQMGVMEGVDEAKMIVATEKEQFRQLKGSRINARQMKVAILLAQDVSNKDIAKQLGYGSDHVSRLSRDPKIQYWTDYYMNKIYSDPIDTYLKDRAPLCKEITDEFLTSTSIPVEKKMQQVNWVFEKLTGKATQQIDHKVNIAADIIDGMDRIAALREVGGKALTEKDQELINPPKEVNKWDAIIDGYIEEAENGKEIE